MEIRLPEAAEAHALRAFLLRAVRDAPDAFASSLELELARPERYWEGLATRTEYGDAPEASVVLAAVDHGRWLAMAGSFWFDRPAGVAQLWGMWVEPSARSRGLGSRLVAEVAGWASDRGAVRLRLGVVDDAAAVAAFYERLGFARTGETKSLPPDGARTAFFMTMPLVSAS
jgi:ribosomal protein S18 acetylase RimI-like enzyme